MAEPHVIAALRDKLAAASCRKTRPPQTEHLGFSCSMEHINCSKEQVMSRSRRGSKPPGRPEEFHLQPPTEPCVNLSIYTARPSHCPAILR